MVVRWAAPLLPRVIGHRGAAAAAPENTLPSLREAKRQGAGGVEFDAKLTADGVPVLFHDETLDRTTNGRGPVARTRLLDIRRLDAGLWFGPEWRRTPVPLLEDALKLVVELDLDVNVEIKPCPGREVETAQQVVRVIGQVWPRERKPPLLSSFAPGSLLAARLAAPELPRGLLLWDDPEGWASQARELACVSVHCAEQYLTAGWAAEIKRAGYALAVYTVNDPVRARVLTGWGADAIITDRPDVVAGAI